MLFCSYLKLARDGCKDSACTAGATGKNEDTGVGVAGECSEIPYRVEGRAQCFLLLGLLTDAHSSLPSHLGLQYPRIKGPGLSSDRFRFQGLLGRIA